MATLIGSSKSLALASTEGNEIDNEQSWEVIYQDQARNEELLQQYGNQPKFQRRCQHFSPVYNCHGMTFASRRTGIIDNATLEQILHEDKYTQIQAEQVLPGDVILYVHKSGDIEHSGIVVEPPSPANFNIPLIMSKWGRYLESVHLANRCPYASTDIRYYRINHGEFKYS